MVDDLRWRCYRVRKHPSKNKTQVYSEQAAMMGHDGPWVTTTIPWNLDEVGNDV